MKFKAFITGILLAFIAFSTAQAADWSQLPKKKQTVLGLYMTANEAYEQMQAHPDSTLFLDVRSRPEVNFLGMPTVADANVPYMELNEWYGWDPKKEGFKMEVNSEFTHAVEQQLADKGLTKNDTIIVMCRSGSRSSKAANLLAGLGYTKVYTVVDGYEGDKAKSGPQKGQRVLNGWKNAGLPWSYKLAKAKMYNIGE